MSQPPTSRSVLTSTVARKIVMGITGLLFFGFLVTHLTANLMLLMPSGESFNAYADRLESLDEILYILEAGLAAIFLLHVVTAIAVTVQNRGTRAQGYSESGDAGGASKKTLASRSMIYTGIIILVFTVVHVWMFKFGPGIAAGYVTELRGHEARDLYKLVYETFQNPLWVGAYVAVMIVLGFHLRHGLWSACQSLGFSSSKYTPWLYRVGTLVAVVMAVGFLIIPILIFLRGTN